MTTTQTTLSDDKPANTSATDREPSSNAKTNLAPPDQRGGDGCCPWCLAEVETFEHRKDNNHPRCGHCDAPIPVGADWYERGEKNRCVTNYLAEIARMLTHCSNKMQNT